MAYTTINKHTDYFNTILYSGNSTDNRSITGVGFQPDWTWVKNRTGTSSHLLTDVLTGVGKRFRSDTDGALGDQANGLKSFDTDGYTAGTTGSINESGNSYVAWNWKAGTTGSGNTTGSGTYKTYSYSVNTTAGFSIVKYTGNGSAGHTIPHHLGAAPKFIVTKQLTGTRSWRIYHTKMGNDKEIYFDTTDTAGTNNTTWNNTAPSSTVFTLGTSAAVNDNDVTYVAYCFAEKSGYSKFGSYTGNGNSGNGVFIYTGFKPSWILIKTTSLAGNNWQMYDNKREGYNPQNDLLRTNSNNAEGNGTDPIDILSNGFKLYNAAGSANQNGGTYIYMAFGQSLVGSNNVPCTAR